MRTIVDLYGLETPSYGTNLPKLTSNNPLLNNFSKKIKFLAILKKMDGIDKENSKWMRYAIQMDLS
jgi:hypothetical protein